MSNIRPYGAPIYDAIKRGDKNELRQLLDQARKLQQEQGDLNKAIQELEAALNKKG